MTEKEATPVDTSAVHPAEQDHPPPPSSGAPEAVPSEADDVPPGFQATPPEASSKSSSMDEAPAGDGSAESQPAASEPKIIDELGPDSGDKQEAEADVDPLTIAKEENARLREKVLRIAADFDNFRKRARRDSEENAKRNRVELLRELLPVFDNMERAVSHAEQAPDVQAVATGVKMVVKQFQDIIGRLGVERVESVGAPFDPNEHEAIQQLETADHPAGTVVAELLAGYRWGERLLRAAMVVVAKAPPAPATDEVLAPAVESAQSAEESSETEAPDEAPEASETQKTPD